jgi:hypothetical protein
MSNTEKDSSLITQKLKLDKMFFLRHSQDFSKLESASKNTLMKNVHLQNNLTKEICTIVKNQ